MRGLFVTGTDTGVGKTVVAAALMLRYGSARPLRYWKPIQTGIEQDDDTREVERLAACDPAALHPHGVRLPRPVSPHLAARLQGSTIALEPLLRSTAGAGEISWVVEGAGGVLVPINDRQTMADLMAALELPVLIAARSGLGTINHTLLTIEALERRRLAVAGVVMVGDPNEDNRDAIERYGGVPVLGQMPRFAPLTPERLAAWSSAELDPSGRLGQFL